jgi:Holliday junction resolvase RusA-like endonuclease
MRTLHFFVSGLPKGQPRVKAFKRGNHAGVYDPGTADAWKGCVRAEFKGRSAELVKPVYMGPVAVAMRFVMPRPKSHLRASGWELKPNAPRYVTTKPDADNLAKAVLDALTDVSAWTDDSVVVSLNVVKTYGSETGCEIQISPLTQEVCRE